MKFKNIIKFVWEFPQNALGWIIKNICKATPIATYDDVLIYSWKCNGGMSLGKYIFVPFKSVSPTSVLRMRYIKHEYGHTMQSKYLGWFYLLVIGLPSLIWSQCFGWYWSKTRTGYYTFYTEKWADKLGGVERK